LCGRRCVRIAMALPARDFFGHFAVANPFPSYRHAAGQKSANSLNPNTQRPT
jgi:hypothetical protein